MEERRLGRWHHADTDTEWQVVEWGSIGHIKNADENRLTRNGLNQSQLTTFAIVYPSGEVRHLTWSGALPDDLEDLVDYWTEHESL